MKTYLDILKENFAGFGMDILSVPLHLIRAFWIVFGALFILAFIFICPVFIPVYSYLQYKDKRKYRNDGFWEAKDYYNYFCD